MQPPTDNLYKFLAIFGLVMIGFSIYVPLQRLEAFSRGSMYVEVAYEPIIDKLVLIDDAARADLECAISAAKKREKGQVTKPDPCEKAPTARAAATVASAELVTLRAKAAKLELERNFLFQQYRQYFVMGIVVGCLGLCLCIAGFWLWYVRLQRFLDAAVKSGAS